MADLNTTLGKFLYRLLPQFSDGPSGVVHVNTTATGNVGAGEDTLWTYDLPAGTLSANGKAIRISAHGYFASNGNAKTIKVYVGTASAALLSSTFNGSGWVITQVVVRTGAAAETWSRLASVATTHAATRASITEDSTAAITLKITGEATANDDVICEAVVVELL